MSYNVAYGYDQLSRLLTENRTKSGPTLVTDAYTLDKVGNRLTRNGQAYTYLDNSDKLGGDPEGNAYNFDLNGNQLAKGGWAYQFDWENQLKKATAPDGKVLEFWYAPDGERIRKSATQNMTTTTVQYVVDAQQAHAQVVLELDGAGAVAAKYCCGDDLLKVSRSGEYYYFYDGLGSTRIITDATGAVKNRYTYSAFGSLLPGEVEATLPNEYLFTGERADAETGLMYLRARYYDPTTARFATLDT